MHLSVRFSIQRLTAVLCIALAFVFAGVSLSSAIDRVQHAPGAPTEHEHLLLSELSIEQAHDNDHHAAQPGEEDSDSNPADHLTGGHHHHGDSGSGMIVPTSAGDMLLAVSVDPHGLAPERRTPSLHTAGPERPPKSLTMNA